MFLLERAAAKVRRLSVSSKLDWFWNSIRPVYELALRLVYRHGLLRDLKGLGEVYIPAGCRRMSLPPDYELKWWERLTDEIREGDSVADVGAFIGLMAVLAARKSGATGKVLAFEPNPQSIFLLKETLRMNRVSGQVEVCGIAVGDAGKPLMLDKQGIVSRIVSSTGAKNAALLAVRSRSLDEVCAGKRIDILKIDVEGYEAQVLDGAKNLLRSEHAPRFILIECHPYMWQEFGTNRAVLEDRLRESGYAVDVPGLPDGAELDEINYHWVMFAAKQTYGRAENGVVPVTGSV